MRHAKRSAHVLFRPVTKQGASHAVRRSTVSAVATARAACDHEPAWSRNRCGPLRSTRPTRKLTAGPPSAFASNRPITAAGA
eukprot:6622074-Prymnesium_polylepis.1